MTLDLAAHSDESGIFPSVNVCYLCFLPFPLDKYTECKRLGSKLIAAQVHTVGCLRGGRKLSDHTGIVVRVADGLVYTVEGNSGNQVRERSYPVGYYEILGYGIPLN